MSCLYQRPEILKAILPSPQYFSLQSFTFILLTGCWALPLAPSPGPKDVETHFQRDFHCLFLSLKNIFFLPECGPSQESYFPWWCLLVTAQCSLFPALYLIPTPPNLLPVFMFFKFYTVLTFLLLSIILIY